MRIAVLGAGGMIGGHLAARLVSEGHQVISVDIKPEHEWYQVHGIPYPRVDLTNSNFAHYLFTQHEIEQVYLLAANMGGIGFIEHEPLACILSVDITSSCLKAARDAKVKRVFYSSSACAYPIELQQGTDHNVALSEDLAWKGRAEHGYGEEKLFSESLCEFFDSHGNLETRVARYHNIYGTHSTIRGGREKAPAAIARKVAEAAISGDPTIEIWGNGQQRRSFCWVDDCVEGTIRLMNSDYNRPLNIGSSEAVSINQLLWLTAEIAGVDVQPVYDLSAPQGVGTRNSDNTLIAEILNWTPTTSLYTGMKKLYGWVYNEVYHGR